MKNMKKMLEKYRDLLLAEEPFRGEHRDRDIESLLRYIAVKDGALIFRDIDYSSNDRAAWDAHKHISRLEMLAVAYAKGNVAIKRETVFSLLDGWLMLDPQCPNWWYNMIGVPISLGNIAIILWDELSFETRLLVLSRLSRGVIFQDYRNKNETGANLLWFAGITMKYALLAEDTSLLALSVKIAAKETEYNVEGIQPDGSFFQHGRLLYSGGYGRSFINSIALMIYIVDGTPFEFPHDALERLMQHIDGLSHMMHRGFLDYAVVGREYVRVGSLRTETLAKDLEYLHAARNFPSGEALSDIIKSLKEKKPSFDGVRYFPDAAYLSMCKNGVFISFSGMAPTLLGAEIINSENKLGYNFSYGTHTTVMQTGREYEDIASLWDYGLIPGTSTPYMTEDELLKVEDFTRKELDIDDFGGDESKDSGVIWVTTRHDGISATVSAFATPYGMIILGNGLADEKGREIVTTVEQCLVTGDVNMSEGEVVHGSVRYKTLNKGSRFVSKVDTVRGNLRRNRVSNPDCETSGEVLTVTLDRGGSNAYAYVIAPSDVDLSGIEVISNDALSQSVKLPCGTVLSARTKNLQKVKKNR